MHSMSESEVVLLALRLNLFLTEISSQSTAVKASNCGSFPDHVIKIGSSDTKEVFVAPPTSLQHVACHWFKVEAEAGQRIKVTMYHFRFPAFEPQSVMVGGWE